jgi:thioredoxin 1
MSNTTINITNDNFESEVIKSDIPVLLDFWAPWCGPCRAVGPVLDELAAELGGSVKIGKVNVDEESVLAENHRVISIPALILYKNAQVVKTQVGALPKEALRKMLA